MTNTTIKNQLEEMNREELIAYLQKSMTIALATINECRAHRINFDMELDKLNRTLDKYNN